MISNLYEISQISLHILGEHLTDGSPSNPDGQEHIGLCFTG